MGGRTSNSAPRLDIPEWLVASLKSLMNAAIADSTKTGYARSWRLYNTFSIEILGSAATLPCSVSEITIFVAYLHAKGYSSSSLPCILSALGYFHKMLGHPDPSKNFLLGKLVAGAKSSNKKEIPRLPITRPVLHKLYQAAGHSVQIGFDRLVFRAAITLGFTAYLRIGEMFTTGQANNCIFLSDVKIIGNEMQISMSRFKTCKSQGTQILRICEQPPPFCPIANLQLFLRHRGEQPGPLFANPNGRGIARDNFDRWLKSTVTFIGLDPTRFKGHSLRIGAASQAAHDGKSDAFIRTAGRWASDAFRRYIRVL